MSTAPYVEPPEPDGERPRERRRLAVLWRLTALLRPHRARFLLALVTLLCASAITLVYPQAARFAIVPPVVLATVGFGRKIRTMTRGVQDALAQVSGQVQESIGAIATVQAFVREDHEAKRYRSGVEGAFRKTLELVRWRAWFFSTA